MTDPISPEELEVTRRLDALDPRWVVDEVREGALETARAAAFRREQEERLEDALARVGTALERRDGAALARAAGDRDVAAAVLASIPAPASVILSEEVFAVAASELREAWLKIGEVPVLSATVEEAAYQSWPWRGQPGTRSPIVLPGEDALAVEVEEYRRARASVGRLLSEMFAADVDAPLATLEAARDLAPQMQQLHERGASLTASVDAANASRRAQGLEWDPRPAGLANVASYTSPALRELDKYRASRREAVAV